MTTSAATSVPDTAAGPPWVPGPVRLNRRVAVGDKKLSERYTRIDPFSVLSSDVRTELSARWKRPCEEAFRDLAERHPDALLLLIEKGGMAPADLTYAAETAGRIAGAERVLLPLLAHGAAVVREGAVFGLGERFADGASEVVERLSRVARGDPSPAVRAAAAGVLTP